MLRCSLGLNLSINKCSMCFVCLLDVHEEAADPGAGGAAQPCAARHEEARLRSWEMERFRGESSSWREHRGSSEEVRIINKIICFSAASQHV